MIREGLHVCECSENSQKEQNCMIHENGARFTLGQPQSSFIGPWPRPCAQLCSTAAFALQGQAGTGGTEAVLAHKARDTYSPAFTDKACHHVLEVETRFQEERGKRLAFTGRGASYNPQATEPSPPPPRAVGLGRLSPLQEGGDQRSEKLATCPNI